MQEQKETISAQTKEIEALKLEIQVLKNALQDCVKPKSRKTHKKKGKRKKHEKPASKKKSENIHQIALFRTLVQIIQPITVTVTAHSPKQSPYHY